MATVETSIDVQQPVQTVYNQWTQFETFPEFMEGVEEVQQIDDETLHWTAEIAGEEREWQARITDQEPDQRIAWTSTTGFTNAGMVTFHRIDDQNTRVTLQMQYDPQSYAEKAADATGMVRRRIEGDLERFKRFIEERGTETGAWRGEV